MARRQKPVSPRYKDPQEDTDARVADLLPRLSLAQKLRQLSGCWSSKLHTQGAFDEAQAKRQLADGIGHVTRIGASSGLLPESSAAFANAIQRVLVEHSEHGIPAIVHEEAIAGYCARGATQFPQAIGQAATFDPPLIRQMAEVVREQMRAVGARQALAPVLDVARDPRWGRVEETFGEDPYLCGRMGVAFVRGLQGEKLCEGVAATAKHFLGYGLSEGGMNHAPVQLGGRQLREVYAEPFAAAIREARLAAVMNAYTSVDGVPCAGSAGILRQLLREELKFAGVVVADYYSIALLMRHHRTAADKGAAGAQALRAGLDVELPAQDCFGAPLETLLAEPETQAELESLIDEAVARTLALKFELGLFEAPYVDEGSVGAVFETPAQRALACEIAEASMVLLENDGTLPLSVDTRIALLGPSADDVRLLLGDYNYPVHAEISYARTAKDEAADLAPTSGVSDADGDPFQAAPYYVEVITPRQGIEERVSIDYQRGCGIQAEQSNEVAQIKEAVALARNSDVAVICVGGRSGLLADATSGEFRDAADLRLTGHQEALIDRVLATGTKTVVVVFGGRAFDLSHFAQRVNGLLQCWLPGETSGTALAKVLFGDVSPSGRLPITLVRGVGQVPSYYGHRSGGGKSMALGSYSDLSNEPLYPFGFGLSYSEFEYGELAGPSAVDTFGVIVVSLTLRNVGERAAAEVVQLYLSDLVADVARPEKALVGFAKVLLAPGERRRLQFHLDSSQAAYYNQNMDFVVDPGEIRLSVGSSSQTIKSELVVLLEGERRQLQQHQIISTRVAVTSDPMHET
ncbi:MAG: glycoside hydrolase family 3 N-terminal domain-containing protein [Pseudomonadales bacterium]